MLLVDGVTKSFGGAAVLQNASMQAAAGAVTGVIGPNGSGKSTLFDVISGVVPADSGSVFLNGEQVSLTNPRKVVSDGIGRTFQIPRFLREMTVLENVMLVSNRHHDETLRQLFNPFSARAVRRAQQQRLSEAIDLLRETSLLPLANQPAGVLSGGQAKLLSAAMLLALDPPCLLLDEPMSGVNAVGVDVLIRLLRGRNDRGQVTVVVEHNLTVVAALCTTVFVLHGGRVIASGNPETLREDPLVRDAYVGRTARVMP